MLQGLSHCVTSLAHLLALQTVNEMLWREMIIQLAGVMPSLAQRAHPTRPADYQHYTLS